jgi:hypothetical protein
MTVGSVVRDGRIKIVVKNPDWQTLVNETLVNTHCGASAMFHAITGIDHCIILVHDLDGAAARMRKLGFAPAARGVHSDHMGTHNHCVMLERGYFEVMAVRMPTQRNQRWREVLAKRQGLSAVALKTPDARLAHEWFMTNDVAAIDPVDFARPVELSANESREASFTTVTLPADVAPVPMFLCQHHTPELVWRPQHLRHPNRVNGVAGVTLVVDDVARAAAGLGRGFGSERVRLDAHAGSVTTEAGWIRLMDAASLAERFAHVPLPASATAPYVAALTLTTEDLGATRECLDANGIAYHEGQRGALCIAPADACGALLEIVALRT